MIQASLQAFYRRFLKIIYFACNTGASIINKCPELNIECNAISDHARAPMSLLRLGLRHQEGTLMEELQISSFQ